MAAVLPEKMSVQLKKFGDGSDASYAFRFLQGLPNIKVILSGMNETDQVIDNLKTFREYIPLSDNEQETLAEFAESMKSGVPCTACRYCCDGCPVGLDIPYLLACYNDYKFSVTAIAGMRLDGLEEEKRPAACIGCGQCAHACPQGIDVPAALAELADMYANGPKWAATAKGRQEAIRKDLHMD